jgi:hypothetical protein
MIQFGVSPKEYWLIGVLALVGWVVGGFADGIGVLAMIGVPLLIGLWIGAIVMIDGQMKAD